MTRNRASVGSSSVAIKPTKRTPKKRQVRLKSASSTLRRSRSVTHDAESALAKRSTDAVDGEATALVSDLGAMIDAARRQVAVAANAALTTLYWELGNRVRSETLKGLRAKYGAQIVAAVGRQLESRYGRGFGEKNLRRMVQFATTFPEAEIVAAVGRQLTWAEYLTDLPPREVLEERLHRAIESARNRLVLGARLEVAHPGARTTAKKACT